MGGATEIETECKLTLNNAHQYTRFIFLCVMCVCRDK